MCSLSKWYLVFCIFLCVDSFNPLGYVLGVVCHRLIVASDMQAEV
ncbi:hypothetical protein DSUL_20354 [Desulfovibrionales bacterium]